MRLSSHLIACSVALFAGHAQSATVKTKTGSRVLLTIEAGENLKPGHRLGVQDSSGTDKAELVVRAVKGNQAIAEIRSGDPAVGDQAKILRRAAPTGFFPPYSWGVVAGFATNNQKVKLTTTTDIELTGSNPYLKVIMSGDARGGGALTWELGLGFEQVKTTGSIASTACGGTGNCSFEATVVNPTLRGGWRLSNGFIAPELRIGADLFVPVTLTSNALSSTAYSPLGFLTGGAVIRLNTGPNTSIPIAIDAAYHLGNNDATMMRILASVGFTWK